MTTLKKFKKDLRSLANPAKAVILQRFFKTGKGEYGEGDKFLGITVPQQRALIKDYMELDLVDLSSLIESPWHEERLCTLLLLVRQYQKTKNSSEQQKIYDFYLDHVHAINNWDLVDLSAPHIVGHYLLPKNKNILYKLAQKSHIWSRRIAIIATQHFIRNDHYQETLALTEQLLNDKEDLMHKACGWMLREVGKRDVATLKNFLYDHYQRMPRTMLRYSIERFPEQERKAYLQGIVRK